MAERRVSVRLGVVGGKEVEATFLDIGNKGSAAMKRLGDTSEAAFSQVSRSSGRMGGGLQNVGYQIQDFAVQVGNGTSATVALSQQLPQLLGGFGALGAVVGAVIAIGVPLAAYFLGINTNAKTAQEGVDDLTAAIDRLKAQQDNYSVAGIQSYIDKYGELNAEVLLLIERQRQFAEGEALRAAKEAVGAFQNEITGGFWSGLIRSDTGEIADALGIEDLSIRIEEVGYEAGEMVTRTYRTINPVITEFQDALEAATSAETFEEQAAAVARLSDLIQGTALEGTEFAGTLLEAEAALRELNNQGDGIGGWLGAAIDWAGSLATNLWDAAAAGSAVRAGQSGGFLSGVVGAIGGLGNYFGIEPPPPPETPGGVRPRQRPMDLGVPDPGRGGAGGGGRSATSDLEREAERIFASTRTEAERYADELKRLDEIKAAGLITGETYDRQLQALGERYQMEGDALATIQSRLEDFVKTSANIADGIGSAFVQAFSAGSDAVADFVKTGKLDFSSLVTNFIADLARLAAQKYIFRPLANMLGGALGGLGGSFANILHEGGIAGSGGGRRSVDPSVFAGAPRFHSGGLAGDEVPAILQRGERVLSKSETAAYDRGGSPTIVFNVKDAASVRQSRSQIAADAARAVSMGRRNS